MGVQINYWISDLEVYNYLSRAGYETTTISNLLKKYHGYKTIGQIQEELCITKSTLQKKVALTEKSLGKITEALTGLVEYCKNLSKEGATKNAKYRRAGTWCLRGWISDIRNYDPELIIQYYLAESVFTRDIREKIKQEIEKII